MGTGTLHTGVRPAFNPTSTFSPSTCLTNSDLTSSVPIGGGDAGRLDLDFDLDLVAVKVVQGLNEGEMTGNLNACHHDLNPGRRTSCGGGDGGERPLSWWWWWWLIPGGGGALPRVQGVVAASRARRSTRRRTLGAGRPMVQVRASCCGWRRLQPACRVVLPSPTFRPSHPPTGIHVAARARAVVPGPRRLPALGAGRFRFLLVLSSLHLRLPGRCTASHSTGRGGSSVNSLRLLSLQIPFLFLKFFDNSIAPCVCVCVCV